MRFNPRARNPHGPSARTVLTLAAFAAAVGASTAAHAALGQPADSVQTDRAHMAARMAAPRAGGAGYTVQTLTTPGGATVQEFVGADGTVFAVAWRGPGRPDLRQLLGDHFATLQADNVRTTGPRTKAPLAVDRAAMVLRTGGHPGAFWGHAYLPDRAPAGFFPRTFQ